MKKKVNNNKRQSIDGCQNKWHQKKKKKPTRIRVKKIVTQDGVTIQVCFPGSGKCAKA